MSDLKQWYYGNPREDMVGYVPAGTRRMLDVGCGWGRFSEAAKRRYGIAETWGIELDPEAAAVARERVDHVLNQDAFVALAGMPEGFFDCAVFNDVLEHLVEPQRLLAALRPHLADGATVVASIPNVRYGGVVLDLLLRGRWDYADFGILDRTHLRFFTRASIARMFDETGYDLVGIDPITPPISRLGRVAARLLPPPLRDLGFMQFACRARPRPLASSSPSPQVAHAR